jgi:hypothetical protein
MCSTCGIVSVPSGNVGFGREPGRRTGCGAVVGVVVLFGAIVLAFVFEDFFDDDEQPARPTTAAPAPSAPSPFNIERRVSQTSLFTPIGLPRAANAVSLLLGW